MPGSCTARSMKWLRDKGYAVANVEKWMPRINIRKDVYGFGDLLVAGVQKNCDHEPCAFAGDVECKFPIIALVQVTSRANMSARIKKILSLPEAIVWLNACGEIWVHGWAIKKIRGIARPTWHLTERKITLGSFQQEVESVEREEKIASQETRTSTASS